MTDSGMTGSFSSRVDVRRCLAALAIALPAFIPLKSTAHDLRAFAFEPTLTPNSCPMSLRYGIRRAASGLHKKSPNHRDVLDTLACAYAQAGDFDRAIETEGAAINDKASALREGESFVLRPDTPPRFRCVRETAVPPKTAIRDASLIASENAAQIVSARLS